MRIEPLLDEITIRIRLLRKKRKIKFSKLDPILLKEFKLRDGDTNKNTYYKGTRKEEGVYLLYKGKNIIYVGETDNMVRRLFGDIGEARIAIRKKDGRKSMFHPLCRHVREKYNLIKIEDRSLATERIKKIIRRDYSVKYITTEDKDMALAIEGILIKHLRKKGHLINKDYRKKK
jgi:hypothetical protein